MTQPTMNTEARNWLANNGLRHDDVTAGSLATMISKLASTKVIGMNAELDKLGVTELPGEHPCDRALRFCAETI